MGTAEFYYSRWNAFAMSTASVVVLIFPVAIMATAVWSLVHYFSSESAIDPKPFYYGSLGVLLGLWMATAFWQRVRYRHAVHDRYVFDSNGIHVESKSGKASIPWEEVGSAEYVPLFFLLRIRTSRIRAPVVLFEGGGPEGNGRYSDRWRIAKNLVTSNLQKRYCKRWLP
jgi:hypothetical protein